MAHSVHTAFITGAGKNIGRAIALALATRGYNLAINGRSDRAACETVANEVRQKGGRAAVVMGDVSSAEEVAKLAALALEEFGTIDVLVSNAAIRPAKPFLETTEAEWHRVLDTNLDSAVRLSRAFLPGMIARNWGRIVVLTGRQAMRGYPGHASTSVSKHGLWGLTKALAREFGPLGITTNAISPGLIQTESEDKSFPARLIAGAKEIPVGRVGTPEEIAATCDLLCSEQGGFINGQMIAVNGGIDT
jgi:3-oxoacyl-[acyl-carrier protein] reductase